MLDIAEQTATLYPTSSPWVGCGPRWKTARLLHIRSSALIAAGRLVWVCKRRS